MKDPRIDRAIAVCKKAVAAFSYSWKKRKDMTEVQAELGLPTHQLVTESPTRWGSRQKMIERFLEQEKAVVRILPVNQVTTVYGNRAHRKTLRVIELALQHDILSLQECRKTHNSYKYGLLSAQCKEKYIRHSFTTEIQPNSLVANHVMPVSCWKRSGFYNYCYTYCVYKYKHSFR